MNWRESASEVSRLPTRTQKRIDHSRNKTLPRYNDHADFFEIICIWTYRYGISSTARPNHCNSRHRTTIGMLMEDLTCSAPQMIVLMMYNQKDPEERTTMKYLRSLLVFLMIAMIACSLLSCQVTALDDDEFDSVEEEEGLTLGGVHLNITDAK